MLLLALAEASEAGFILELYEFLIIESRMMDRHVERETVRPVAAAEAEVSSSVGLIQLAVGLDRGPDLQVDDGGLSDEHQGCQVHGEQRLLVLGEIGVEGISLNEARLNDDGAGSRCDVFPGTSI